MTAPAPTNPDAVFPAHNLTASFSFPKEEEKTLKYVLLDFLPLDRVAYSDH